MCLFARLRATVSRRFEGTEISDLEGCSSRDNLFCVSSQLRYHHTLRMGFNIYHKPQEYLCSIQWFQSTICWKPLPAKEVQEFDKIRKLTRTPSQAEYMLSFGPLFRHNHPPEISLPPRFSLPSHTVVQPLSRGRQSQISTTAVP